MARANVWCAMVAAGVVALMASAPCSGMASVGPEPPKDVHVVKKEGEKPVSETAKPVEAAAEKPGKTSETMSEGCVRELFTVPSPSMKREIRVAVVVPPEYATKPEARYPVLYAMHGMGAPYMTFTDMSPLRAYMVDHPMILVCFDGDRASCYVDSTEKADSQFTTFFFDELMPFIDKTYRTNGQVAATGFSMGGYGSFHYMLTHPERFVSVSSLSGAFMLFAPPRAAAGTRRGDLLGDYEKNKAAYEAAYIYGRVKRYVSEGVHLPPMLIRCGTEDGLLAGNRDFVNLLIAQNGEIRKKMQPLLEGITDKDELRKKTEELGRTMLLDFEYTETPGGHDWPYWRGVSRAVAEFHWRHFQAAAAAKK